MNQERLIRLIVNQLFRFVAAKLRARKPLAGSLSTITQTINTMARNGAEIRLSTHARERMEQRQMSLDDIRTVLAEGVVRKPPRRGEKGDLIYKIEDDNTRGFKDGEVALVLQNNGFLIVTAMWDGENTYNQ